MTVGGAWADAAYGCRPVYLSREPGHRSDAFPTSIVLEVDASAVELYPDLPTLVDHGAYLEESGEGLQLWWESGTEPTALLPFLDEGSLLVADLLADPAARDAAIAVTGTAAVLEPFAPARLRRYN
jgi:hypothetical protein